MSRTARRLDGVDSTIFAEMSALAVRTGAVNLGQGFPDVSGPPAVVEEAVAALRAGRNQYPPGHGAPELVDAVRRHQQRHYGIALEREQVVVTTGATEAIAGALLGLVDPGDEVIVLEPFYDSYRAMIQFAGAVRRPVTLRALVQNVFDTNYWAGVASFSALSQGVPRTLLLSMSTDF